MFAYVGRNQNLKDLKSLLISVALSLGIFDRSDNPLGFVGMGFGFGRKSSKHGVLLRGHSVLVINQLSQSGGGW